MKCVEVVRSKMELSCVLLPKRSREKGKKNPMNIFSPL